MSCDRTTCVTFRPFAAAYGVRITIGTFIVASYTNSPCVPSPCSPSDSP
jgi:hypothetical protein